MCNEAVARDRVHCLPTFYTGGVESLRLAPTGHRALETTTLLDAQDLILRSYPPDLA